MAKKKVTDPADTPAPRRRTTKQSLPGAAPLGIASAGGVEPLASADDRALPPLGDPLNAPAMSEAPIGAPATAGRGTVAAPSHDDIARRAYERYLNRGADHGRDFDDWVEAERELRERRES